MVHRLLEFFVLLGEGLHPLYQLAALLGSPSYLLQMHNDNVEIQFLMSKRSIPDAILTLISFVTLARVVSSLLNSLVVSSSSTITMSLLRFRSIQTAWGRGSSHSISSTSSSSAVAGGTT